MKCSSLGTIISLLRKVAKVMTNVVCSAAKCNHNEKGYCSLETLSVTSSLMDREAECAFYEPEEK